jgi:hypothetical protein
MQQNSSISQSESNIFSFMMKLGKIKKAMKHIRNMGVEVQLHTFLSLTQDRGERPTSHFLFAPEEIPTE